MDFLLLQFLCLKLNYELNQIVLFFVLFFSGWGRGEGCEALLFEILYSLVFLVNSGVFD